MDVVTGTDDWQFTFRAVDENAQSCACPVLSGSPNAKNAAASSSAVNRVVIEQHEDEDEDDGDYTAYAVVIEKLDGDDIRASVTSWMRTVNLSDCVAHYTVNENSLFGIQSQNVLVITFTVCDADESQNTTYYENVFRGLYSEANNVTAQVEWFNSPTCATQRNANANNRRRALLQSSTRGQNDQDQEVTVVIVFTDAADATQANKEGACSAAETELAIEADSCVVSTVDESEAAQITGTLTDDIIAVVFGSVHVAVVVSALMAVCLLVCFGACFYARWRTKHHHAVGSKLSRKAKEHRESQDDRAQVMTLGRTVPARIASQRFMVANDSKSSLNNKYGAIPDTPSTPIDDVGHEGMKQLQHNVSRKVLDVEMASASSNNSNMPFADKTKRRVSALAEEPETLGLAFTISNAKSMENYEYEEIVAVGDDGIGKLSAVYHSEHKQQDFLGLGGGGGGADQPKPMSEEDMLDTVISAKNANEIFMDDLVLDAKAIGNGQFGVVYKATWNGNVVVVKQLNSETEPVTVNADVALSKQHQQEVAAKSEARRKEMTAEVLLASSLPPHSNLVEIFGYVKSPFAVVMSYMHGDSVQKFVYRALRQPSDRIPSIIELLIILRKAANGLKFLHQHNLVHRDIACRNILLGKMQNGIIGSTTEVRISDFGLTRQLNDDDDGGNETQSNFGPLKWMAPESIQHRQYSKKSDVYMFSITMWEIFFGMEPYGSTGAFQIANGVVRNKLRPTLDMDRNEHRFTDMPEEYETLMQSCWHGSPSKRPDFAEVVTKLVQIEKSPRPRVP